MQHLDIWHYKCSTNKFADIVQYLASVIQLDSIKSPYFIVQLEYIMTYHDILFDTKTGINQLLLHFNRHDFLLFDLTFWLAAFLASSLKNCWTSEFDVTSGDLPTYHLSSEVLDLKLMAVPRPGPALAYAHTAEPTRKACIVLLIRRPMPRQAPTPLWPNQDFGDRGSLSCFSIPTYAWGTLSNAPKCLRKSYGNFMYAMGLS